MPPYAALRLAASRGCEAEAARLIQAAIEQAAAAGQGAVTSAHWAAASLYNGAPSGARPVPHRVEQARLLPTDRPVDREVLRDPLEGIGDSIRSAMP